MAGDWIKMRMELQTHPKVVRISSALQADILRTIGGLFSAWCLFDVQSEDGKLKGMTLEHMDYFLRWPGFSQAMLDVEWLVKTDQGIEMPRFENHNGRSAKRRCLDANRTAVRRMSASQADTCPHDETTKSGPEKIRLEKRIEESNSITLHPADAVVVSQPQKEDPMESEFMENWNSIRKSIPTPTRHNRKLAMKAWARRRKELPKDVILWWWFEIIVKTAKTPEGIPAFDVEKQWGAYEDIVDKFKNKGTMSNGVEMSDEHKLLWEKAKAQAAREREQERLMREQKASEAPEFEEYDERA
jgi:hypothetical protein